MIVGVVGFIYMQIYEGHLEISLHVIITPQCVDKMRSNNTVLETRIQWQLDGLFFCRKRNRRARAAHA